MPLQKMIRVTNRTTRTLINLYVYVKDVADDDVMKKAKERLVDTGADMHGVLSSFKKDWKHLKSLNSDVEVGFRVEYFDLIFNSIVNEKRFNLPECKPVIDLLSSIRGKLK